MCHRALLDPRSAHFFCASMKTWLSRPERAAADVAGQRCIATSIRANRVVDWP